MRATDFVNYFTKSVPTICPALYRHARRRLTGLFARTEANHVVRREQSLFSPRECRVFLAGMPALGEEARRIGEGRERKVVGQQIEIGARILRETQRPVRAKHESLAADRLEEFGEMVLGRSPDPRKVI